MKIAIPSTDGKMIFPHFGRTTAFAIITVENNRITKKDIIENSFTGHARSHGQHEGEHHAHSHGSILDALNDCRVVISGGMGRRLMDDLQSAGKEVFITTEREVDRAVMRYVDGDLEHDPERGCEH
jgi:predicted Fe-Mo cluster-binding NifX family protein